MVKNNRKNKVHFSYKFLFKRDINKNKDKNEDISYYERMRKLRNLIYDNPYTMSFLVMKKYPSLFK